MDLNYDIIFTIVSMLDMYSLYKMHGVFLETKIKNRKQLILSYLIFYLISTCAHFVIDVPIVMLLVNC